MGGNSGQNHYSTGRFDLVLLWIGRALAASEIDALAGNPWQIYAPSQSWWLFRSGLAAFPRNPLVVQPVRQPVRQQLPIKAKSPGGNPAVRPTSPPASLARPPARTVAAVLAHTRYVPPVVGFPARTFPVPYRARQRGGAPPFLRQSIPGMTSTVPPIAFNLNAWHSILLSSGGDPLAVNPDGAVAASSDSDPLAVDPDSAIQVN